MEQRGSDVMFRRGLQGQHSLSLEIVVSILVQNGLYTFGRGKSTEDILSGAKSTTVEK